MNDDNIDSDDITIDLGNVHIDGGSGYDTLSIGSIDTIDMSTYYTVPTTATTGTNYTISTAGSNYTVSNGTWGAVGTGGITSMPYITTTSNSAISVDGDAEFKGSVKVKGKDLGDWMESLEKRLSILVPNPKKLEQYEALQKAYNHYKMLEALCEERDDEDESK